MYSVPIQLISSSQKLNKCSVLEATKQIFVKRNDSSLTNIISSTICVVTAHNFENKLMHRHVKQAFTVASR